LHASVTLFRNSDALRAGFDCATPYIYQTDSNVPSEAQKLDWLGKYTFQCSRPVDAVKVWFIFRHLGSLALSEKVEHAISARENLAHLIDHDPRFSKNFRLLHRNPEFTNL
jgi:glutamate/tyrosine decarboxylase-like PLP-dependent enzyme